MNWTKKLVRTIGRIEDIFSENLQRGKTIHYALSLIKKFPIDMSGEDLYKIIEEKVKIAYEIMKQVQPGKSGDQEKLISQIVNILQKEELRNYFFLKNGEVFNEKDIVDANGDTKRIDRLVITTNEVCVIEYKTGENYKEEHEYQIKEYIKLVKEIYKERYVKGLLVYIDEAEIKSYN